MVLCHGRWGLWAHEFPDASTYQRLWHSWGQPGSDRRCIRGVTGGRAGGELANGLYNFSVAVRRSGQTEATAFRVCAWRAGGHCGMGRGAVGHGAATCDCGDALGRGRGGRCGRCTCWRQAVSTQSTSHVVTATVQMSDGQGPSVRADLLGGCTVPAAWAWRFVLVEHRSLVARTMEWPLKRQSSSSRSSRVEI